MIFDLGFYPYGYGYGYYPYGGAYPYYDNGYYDDSYASSEYSQDYDSSTDSSVSQVQSALAREGYYRGAIDGSFGPRTKASVKAFQSFGDVPSDGVIGDQTWAVSLHAASATLESAVGLRFVID